MAAARLSFRFSASLVRLEQGVRYHALPVPAAAAAAWRKAKVRRLVGTFNGHPVKRALMAHADGDAFLIVGRELMDAADLNHRKPVEVALRPDPTPHAVDVPPEFTAVLNDDPEARARWETFTPGRQRSLMIYITTAKTEPTRIQRALTLARMIRTHTLHGDLAKKRRPA